MNPPKWQAHTAPDYEEAMTQACQTVFDRVRSDAEYRMQIRADPRPLHRELFHRFTPAGYEEYAGTYRGTVGTTLFARVAGAQSVLHDDEKYSFCAPDEVAARMKELNRQFQESLAGSRNRELLAYQFAWFGRIHPFLDGNGHVQRTLFAALAIELGFALHDRFAIHPRPYDRLFAIALELFSRSPEPTAHEQLGIVREYLNFFIS